MSYPLPGLYTPSVTPYELTIFENITLNHKEGMTKAKLVNSGSLPFPRRGNALTIYSLSATLFCIVWPNAFIRECRGLIIIPLSNHMSLSKNLSPSSLAGWSLIRTSSPSSTD